MVAQDVGSGAIATMRIAANAGLSSRNARQYNPRPLSTSLGPLGSTGRYAVAGGS